MIKLKFSELRKITQEKTMAAVDKIVIDCFAPDGIEFFLRYFNGKKMIAVEDYKYPITLIILDPTRTHLQMFFKYPGFVDFVRKGFNNGINKVSVNIIPAYDFVNSPTIKDQICCYYDGIDLIKFDITILDVNSIVASIKRYPEIGSLIDNFWIKEQLSNLTNTELMFQEWDKKRRDDYDKVKDSILKQFLAKKTAKTPGAKIQSTVLMDEYNFYSSQFKIAPVNREVFSKMMMCEASEKEDGCYILHGH